VDEFGVDLEEIARTVERAKVLDIQFDLLGESLLIDFRAVGTDRPLAVILPKASSRRERMRSVKALRPDAPIPERIAGFSWPRHFAALRDAGVLQRIVERIQATGFEPDDVLREALLELAEHELALRRDSVRGSDGFQTIWEKPT
jgi:hypothetical protein